MHREQYRDRTAVRDHAIESSHAEQFTPVPGKRTLTEGLVGQHREAAAGTETAAPATARLPVSAGGSPRPTLQMLFGGARDAARDHDAGPDRTGLPAEIRRGVEQLSGHDLSDVRVHRGSSRPAELGALAFTEGNDIHVGPGEDRHLAHEAWHVVQQRSGRVAAQPQFKAAGLNLDSALEREADEMGERALALGASTALADRPLSRSSIAGAPVRQMRFSAHERGQLAQLPQVASSGDVNGAIDALRDHTTRSAADLIQLAQVVDRVGQTPTLQEMVQLDRFNNAGLQTVGAIQQVTSWANLVQLAQGTRSAQDLATLAALQVGGVAPTLPEMVAVDRFSVVDLQTLSGRPPFSTWPALVQIAAGTRSAQDLVALSLTPLGGATPTVPEMVALERFSNNDIQNIGQTTVPTNQVASWAEFGQLAELTRSANDLVTLAALAHGGRVPSRAEIVALDRLALADIQNLIQVPQVTSWPELVQLATGTRPGPDLVALAALQINNATPSLAEMIAVDRFTLAQIQQLSGQPQVTSWAALVQLAAGTRSAQDLLALSQAPLGGATPTVPEMVALERFSNTDIQNVGQATVPTNQVTSWAEFGQLAGLTRSANDLVTLAGTQRSGRVPTRPEIIALDRFSLGDLQTLGGRPALAAWDQLALLGPLARTPADLIALSALQIQNIGLTAAELVTLEPAQTAEITALHGANLQQVTSWADLVQLARLGRPANEIIGRAQAVFNGTTPTLQQLVDTSSYSNQELNAVSGLQAVQDWTQLAQSVHGVDRTLYAVIQSMAGTLNNDLAELAGLLGAPAPDLWHYVATLIDIDHSLPSIFTNLEQRVIIGDLMRASSYNSCFDGANRLVQLIGTENAQVSYQSGGNRDTQYNQATQAQRALLLGQHLTQAAAITAPTLFRIHLGGHGFTLTTEHGQIYQLESLAGAGDPGTLLQSIQNGYIHAVAQCCQDFVDMTSNSVALRTQGAGHLHWNAGPIAILAKSVPHAPAYDIIKDPMEIWWTASPLLSRDQIVQVFTQKIQQNRLALLNKIR